MVAKGFDRKAGPNAFVNFRPKGARGVELSSTNVGETKPRHTPLALAGR